MAVAVERHPAQAEAEPAEEAADLLQRAAAVVEGLFAHLDEDAVHRRQARCGALEHAQIRALRVDDEEVRHAFGAVDGDQPVDGGRHHRLCRGIDDRGVVLGMGAERQDARRLAAVARDVEEHALALGRVADSPHGDVPRQVREVLLQDGEGGIDGFDIDAGARPGLPVVEALLALVRPDMQDALDGKPAVPMCSRASSIYRSKRTVDRRQGPCPGRAHRRGREMGRFCGREPQRGPPQACGRRKAFDDAEPPTPYRDSPARRQGRLAGSGQRADEEDQSPTIG